MRILNTLAVLFAVALLAAPLAGAQHEKSPEYIVGPADDNNSVVGISSTGRIIQGESVGYTRELPGGLDIMWVDLNWGNAANSLTLTVYPPTGGSLGPYHDADDGIINGRIYLYIKKSTGNLPSGTWGFNVYGERVDISQQYGFMTYY